jgi:predicted neuraminidase
MIPFILLLGISGPVHEFVYEKAPFPSAHASTILELPDGTILCAWFGGTDEGAPDVEIWLASRAPSVGGAGRWTEPRRVAGEPGVPSWNPVLALEPQGGEGGAPVVWLFAKVGTSPETWSGTWARSFDGGKTFRDGGLLPAGILGPIKNKPLLTPEGDFLCGSSVESHRAWSAWVEIIHPAKEHWSKHGPIEVPGKRKGIIQPSIIPLDAPGTYRLFARATGDIGRVCVSDSADGGKTWSDARPLALSNPDSGLDAVRLRDGRVVLAHNDLPTGRTPLVLSVSSNLGETWRRAVVLEDAPGEYSYPAVIQLANGRLAVSYTWRRERIRYACVPLDRLEATRTEDGSKSLAGSKEGES